MKKQKVLFVCVHNSARSQMAEAFLNQLAGDKFEARSAGLEPGALHPHAVKVMEEIGIDISGNHSKDVFEFFKRGALFHFVITVCDGANAERCPVFPGHAERIHWSFDDPAALTGTDEEKLRGTRIIRDRIREKIKQWIESF